MISNCRCNVVRAKHAFLRLVVRRGLACFAWKVTRKVSGCCASGGQWVVWVVASATLSQAPLGEMHTKCRLTQSTYFQMYSHTQTQSLNFETLIYSAFESESQHHLKIRRTFLLCFLLKRLTECKPTTHQMICSLRIVFKITQGGSSQLFLTGKEGKR